MKPKSKPSTKSNEKIVRMRIVCVDPLEHTKHNAIFGVQDKKRVEHEGVKQSNGDIHYDIEVRAKCDVVDSINRFDLPETKKPNFLGPWTNGKPATNDSSTCRGNQSTRRTHRPGHAA